MGMKKKRLVTSALPYVNNIPHLGNLVQVLSADVFARYCRSAGYETLYACGTDEYGTATETRALQQGITPRELCDHYHAIHRDIYKWFNISFDKFGRTSDPIQTEITQSIFLDLDREGYINDRVIEQLYCNSCHTFLADRFVGGTCPHCGSDDARGDQCDSCGKLLDPTDLVEPRCGTCGSTPEIRSTHHLFIDLPKILPKLEAWMDMASVKGFWARNAVQMTKSWIRDGLKERCITRDLRWGIPVPKKGFEDKVFYVWFDAPIGYISITAGLTNDWKSWWQNPDNVELYQFIGKDNIPFHTVIFPSSLLGSGKDWTMLHHMSSSEYLNYEGGKFSKSNNHGIFGDQVQETGIPADYWRFYIFYNRPEKSDVNFTWEDLKEKVNGELIGNIGNLVNRTLTFVHRFYHGKLGPDAGAENLNACGTAGNTASETQAGDLVDPEIVAKVAQYVATITNHFERAELRDALRQICALSSYGNKIFQAAEPWNLIKEDSPAVAQLLRGALHIIKALATLLAPYIPESAQKIGALVGFNALSLADASKVEVPLSLPPLEKLFTPIDDVEVFQKTYSNTKENHMALPEHAEQFKNEIDLRVGTITTAKKHPEADKLYIFSVEVGDEEPRQIVSGLVGHYEMDELVEKNIIVAYNLKPAKFRGEKSQGMLLAASIGKGEDEIVDVIFVPDAKPGDRVTLQGCELPEEAPKRIKIDRFFETPIEAKGSVVQVAGIPLVLGEKPVTTLKVADGSVG